MNNSYKCIIKKVFVIIKSFPKSKNGSPFLTLKNGKRLYFKIFIKKYGIDGSDTVYSQGDVLRRVRLIEFFDYFTKKFDVTVLSEKKMIIESKFYRMVILKIGKKGKEIYELISFYPY